MIPVLRRVFVGLFQVSSANIITGILGAATTVLFARYLSIQDLGTALTIMAFCSALGSWTALGVEDFLVSDIPRLSSENNPSEGYKLFKSFVVLKLGFTLLVSLVIWGAFELHIFQFEFLSNYGIIIIYMISESISGIIQTGLTAYSKFSLFALNLIIGSLTRLIGAVILIFIPVASFGYMVMIHASGLLIPSIILSIPFFKFLRGIPYFPAESKVSLTSVFKSHGKWNLLLRVMMQFIDPLPILLLSIMVDRQAVAVYHIAARFVSFLQSPLTGADSVLRPIFSGLTSGVSEIAGRITKYLLFVSIFLLLFGLLFTSNLIPFLFSDQYLSSISLSLILMPAIISMALRVHQRPIFFTLRRQDLLLISYILSSLVNFIFLSTFTYFWSIKGFATAQLVGTFTIFLLREFQLSRIGAGFRLASLFTMDDTDRHLLRKGMANLYQRFAMRGP